MNDCVLNTYLNAKYLITCACDTIMYVRQESSSLQGSAKISSNAFCHRSASCQLKRMQLMCQYAQAKLIFFIITAVGLDGSFPQRSSDVCTETLGKYLAIMPAVCTARGVLECMMLANLLVGSPCETSCCKRPPVSSACRIPIGESTSPTGEPRYFPWRTRWMNFLVVAPSISSDSVM